MYAIRSYYAGKWGFPILLVSSTSSIIIMAIDESQPEIAGEIGLVNINPENDDQDGSPVQVRTDTDFLRTPPGEAILPTNFNLFRPEAFIDGLSQIHITGYGTGGTRSTYYGFRLTGAWPYVQFQKIPVPVGLGSSEFPVSLTGDYTRSGLAFLTGGKVIIFWSGEVSGTGNRNLDVTGLPAASAIETSESVITSYSIHYTKLYEEQARTVNRVRSALTYPLLMASVAGLVIVFLLSFVVPKIVGVFSHLGQALPLPTRVLITVSGLFAAGWWVLLLLLGGLVLAGRRYLATDKGKRVRDSLLLRLPILGRIVHLSALVITSYSIHYTKLYDDFYLGNRTFAEEVVSVPDGSSIPNALDGCGKG